MHTSLTLVWLLLAALMPAQTPPAPTKPNPSAPIIDNERVTVWDIDQSGPPPRAAGATNPESLEVALTPPGRVFWHAQGATGPNAESKTTGRRILIDLKDRPVMPIKNTSEYPNAFPRQGIKKLLENQHFIVWDYTWKMGEATPMHFHNTDVVVVFLQDGDLKSVTPNGEQVVNSYAANTVRFNAANRIHNEELVKGTERAIIVELK